jgi:general secretion pathway protein F
MAVYRYKALDAHGELTIGEMDAASDTEVIARLQDQGQLPVEARLASEGALDPDRLRQWLGRRPFDGAAQVEFTQQLATLLAAGQPLDRALTILLELPDDDRSQRIIADIRDVVRGGGTLSTALEHQHGVFSRLYINMVRAGEAGGNLHETLQRLADYLERGSELRSKVINALIYPAILLSVVVLAMLFLLGYVVPQFALMYESLDVVLPWFTRATLATGLFVRDAWWLLVLVPGLVTLWLAGKWQKPVFRERLDAWTLRLKLIGPLLARLETARLSRTLGTLLHNGVPLLAALQIGRNVMNNRVLAGDIGIAIEEVKNGRSLAAALARGGRFPRLALQMIQVGEESGALDSMLLRTADTFEKETSRAIDRLLAALVPAITLLLAAVVGVVIITVLVPLYDLTNAIG